MSSFWKQLADSARAAAGEYRQLAAQHKQELSSARQTFQAAHRANVEDFQRAVSRAALYADTDAMHAALEAALRESLLASLPAADATRAEAVLARLHSARPDEPVLTIEVVASPEPLAFVGFGQAVYLSTGMLSLLPGDDALAFVIGHEVAHIDAGDNRLAATLAARMPVLPETLPVQVGLGLLVRTWMSPQRELAADRGGQALATRAGYAPDGFEAVFDALAAVAYEKQLPVLVERDLPRWGEFLAQKLTGYPSLRERQGRLRRSE